MTILNKKMIELENSKNLEDQNVNLDDSQRRYYS